MNRLKLGIAVLAFCLLALSASEVAHAALVLEENFDVDGSLGLFEEKIGTGLNYTVANGELYLGFPGSYIGSSSLFFPQFLLEVRAKVGPGTHRGYVSILGAGGDVGWQISYLDAGAYANNSYQGSGKTWVNLNGTEYHVYSMLIAFDPVTDTYNVYYAIDGTLYATRTAIIASMLPVKLEIGDPYGTGTQPNEMWVDYVKVYSPWITGEDLPDCSASYQEGYNDGYADGQADLLAILPPGIRKNVEAQRGFAK